jgi:hypothetical protein
MKESAEAARMKEHLELYLYTGEEFQSLEREQDLLARTPMREQDGGWQFNVEGTGFEGTFQIELDWVPEDGEPRPLRPRGSSKDTVPA